MLKIGNLVVNQLISVKHSKGFLNNTKKTDCFSVHIGVIILNRYL
ncbi:hypothetical protein SAMN04488033_101358 [Salegentibacter agarivorans]|jgi:hypothetical protein|uniref:Uncharacterized protein n=1 Tax=Salegentibacter agarivorans TaxID=345907 RepID=A0A1I2K5H4_9FLAO|nr:hypothetical protein SAMN04488033_101358 [Salegentibacter agarivorans]